MGVVKDVAELLRDLWKFAGRHLKHRTAKDRLSQAYREALKERPNVTKIKSIVRALKFMRRGPRRRAATGARRLASPPT